MVAYPTGQLWMCALCTWIHKGNLFLLSCCCPWIGPNSRSRCSVCIFPVQAENKLWKCPGNILGRALGWIYDGVGINGFKMNGKWKTADMFYCRILKILAACAWQAYYSRSLPNTEYCSRKFRPHRKSPCFFLAPGKLWFIYTAWEVLLNPRINICGTAFWSRPSPAGKKVLGP